MMSDMISIFLFMYGRRSKKSDSSGKLLAFTTPSSLSTAAADTFRDSGTPIGVGTIREFWTVVKVLRAFTFQPSLRLEIN